MKLGKPWQFIFCGLFFIVMAYVEVLGFSGSSANRAKSEAPLNFLANQAGVGFLGDLIGLGAMLSFFACVLASLNPAARVFYTMARHGLFHASLGEANESNQTPHIAVAIAAVLTFTIPASMTVLGLKTFESTADLGTICTYGFLLVYILVSIAAGQYLGFTALVIASLPGFFGGLILPRPWIGLLGLVPIAIGFSSLFNREEDESVDLVGNQASKIPLLNMQIYSVAAIAFANGSDNISIYVPLFANSNWQSMLIMIGIFLILVGVWCYAANLIINQQAIAQHASRYARLMTRYAHHIVPFVLMAIGAFIVWESELLTGLTTVANNI